MRDNDCCFVGVVDVDFVLVEDRDYFASTNIGMLRRESRLIPGTICTSFAGWCTLCLNLSMLLASSTLPLVMQKALSNWHPVATNAFLFLTLFVLTLDVALLSATAEGVDPSRTPCFNLLMLLTCSTGSFSCLSTWQVGGALSVKIE